MRAPADLVAARILGPAVSARAYLPTAAGTVARVHRDLHRDVTATSRALRAARRAGRPEDGLERSVVGLVRLARELQLDLRIVAAEPDRRVRARMLAEQATRATVIHRACAQVRTALLEERTGTHEAALQRIVEDVNDAVTAVSLRARARAYRELSHL